MQPSMTALVSAFARAWHAEHNAVPVFHDPLARALLSQQEYEDIARHMTAGAAFFSAQGADPLRTIVDGHLAPTPLGRAAFAEATLQRAVALGARQYLIFGAGYDTFAYRRPPWAEALRIFELDRPEMQADKQRRLAAAGLSLPEALTFVPAELTGDAWAEALDRCPAFRPGAISVCSLLGLLYYLPAEALDALLERLRPRLAPGSALVFDYPVSLAGEQARLAQEAGETMQAAWSYAEMEALLDRHGFLLYEHLTPAEITAQYFAPHDRADPDHPMEAEARVNYCLAVKQP